MLSCRLDLSVSLDSAGKSGGLFSKGSKRRYLIASDKMATKQVIRTQPEFVALEKSLAERFPYIVLPPLREPYLTEALNEIAENPFIRCDAAFEGFVGPSGDISNLPQEDSEGQLRWKQAVTSRSADNPRATVLFMNALRGEFESAISSMKKLLKALGSYQQKLEALAVSGLELSNALGKRLEHEEASKNKALASLPFDKMLSILDATTKSMKDHNEATQEASAARFHAHVVVPMQYDIVVLLAWKNQMDLMRKKFRLFAKLGEKISKEKDPAKLEKMERERAELEVALYQYEQGTLGIELERLRNQRCERLQEWQHSLAEFHLDLGAGLNEAWQFLQPKMDLEAPKEAGTQPPQAFSMPPGLSPGTGASSKGRKPKVHYHFSLSAAEMRKRKIVSGDFQDFMPGGATALAPVNPPRERARDEDGRTDRNENGHGRRFEQGTETPQQSVRKKKPPGPGKTKPMPRAGSVSKLRQLRNGEGQSESTQQSGSRGTSESFDSDGELDRVLQPSMSRLGMRQNGSIGQTKNASLGQMASVGNHGGTRNPRHGKGTRKPEHLRKPKRSAPPAQPKSMFESETPRPPFEAAGGGAGPPPNFLNAIKGFNKTDLQVVEREEEDETIKQPKLKSPGDPGFSAMDELRQKLAKRKETHKDGARV